MDLETGIDTQNGNPSHHNEPALEPIRDVESGPDDAEKQIETSAVAPISNLTPEPPRSSTTPKNLTPAYKLQFILSGHTRSISSIKFSPDGKLLASSGVYVLWNMIVHPSHSWFWKLAADKLVKIWDADNGEIVHTLEGHTEGISDIAWSPDGEFLASASDDKTIRLWSLESVRNSYGMA